MPSPLSATLSNGVPMPLLGFGVWQVLPESATTERVLDAVEAGYRLVDTASVYGNEWGVGQALRKVDRDDVFVTSKVWNRDQGRDATLTAFDATMDRLGLEILDLYLVHWPVPSRGLYVETWHALEELLAQGRVRAIGVSNFHAVHLDRLAAESDTVPMVNQIECHPYLQQRDLVRENESRGIVTQAWSPLGQGQVLGDPVIVGIAAELGRTPAQVVLAWLLGRGIAVLPRSSTPSRIVENFRVQDVELRPEQVTAIDAVHRGVRTGPHPDDFIDNF